MIFGEADIKADIEADIEYIADMPSEAALHHVSELVHEMHAQENAIAEIKSCLKEAEAKLHVLTHRDLPEAVEQFGLKKITLSNGSTLSIQPVYAARISKEAETAAFEWLVERGFGSLVKENVRTYVHPSTLKAFIKEMTRQGRLLELPEELFHPFAGQKAVLTR